jgi:hypothetical protein
MLETALWFERSTEEEIVNWLKSKRLLVNALKQIAKTMAKELKRYFFII